MKEYRLTDWLPTTKKEVELRGWNELDVVLFSADAYVDHPSFGAAVIGRILEAEGIPPTNAYAVKMLILRTADRICARTILLQFTARY